LAKRVNFDGNGDPVVVTVLNPNEVVKLRLFKEHKKPKEVVVSSSLNFCREMSFSTRDERAETLLNAIGCDKWAKNLKANHP